MSEKHQIIFNGAVLNLTKEKYEEFINSKPNKEFLKECSEVSKMFEKRNKI